MPFARDKHIKYWRMCANILPHHYISNDCSRMTLGFFIISALDLLDSLDNIDQQERQGWVNWIYQCQVPEGGFRGSTSNDLRNLRTADNASWDPANVSFTFFALVSLLILGDDLSRVVRDKCLRWLPRLQREDGSFGESISEFENIEGDRDLRHCYCAAGIAFILQERQGPQRARFDENGLIRYIQSCQDLSGGFGVSPFREPHSGLSYCGIGALAFLQCLHKKPSDHAIDLIPDPGRCLRWLLDRQTTFIEEDDDNDDSKIDDGSENDLGRNDASNISNQSATLFVAGFNGREAKIADTCYAFWNTGALAILGQERLIDADALLRYLLDVTQHLIGGFGKGRGEPPDVLHSYLGLAVLAVLGRDGVKALDPMLCISRRAAANLDKVNWGAEREILGGIGQHNNN